MTEALLGLPAAWLGRGIVFILAAFRFSGLALAGPLFASDAIPMRIRAGITIALAAVVSPLLPPAGPACIEAFRHLPQAAGLIASELVIGLAVGLVFDLVLAGIAFGGHLLAQQIGFTLAEVIDPVTFVESTLVGQFKQILAMFVFVALNVHIVIVAIVIRSFSVLPPGGAVSGTRAAAAFGGPMGSGIFELGMRVAGPGMLALLLCTVAMAFIARAVPEINIFIIGFALRVIVGLGVVLLSIPFLAELFAELFRDAGDAAVRIVQALAGGGR
ncbi:MAG: flagellar biosynthetic protein FliR [Planctomycetes bacterium]|nr:flagellar biosynthetic protein FliR [Planctomycetota bacterium]